MLPGIVSGTFWFAVFLVAHVWLFHARPVSNRFKAIIRIFAGAVIGHGLTMLFAAEAFGSRGWMSLLSGLVVMACLFVLYMPFFFTIGTSLSVQTMIRIDRAAGCTVPVTELREAFASKRLLVGRLETMVANGYLVRDGDRYQVSLKGQVIAKVFAALKGAWRLGKGG